MSDSMLKGKRILITHADQFMGPVLCEVFKERGADVISDYSSLNNSEETEGVINVLLLVLLYREVELQIVLQLYML